MKLLKAIIRPNKLEEVKDALTALGVVKVAAPADRPRHDACGVSARRKGHGRDVHDC